MGNVGNDRVHELANSDRLSRSETLLKQGKRLVDFWHDRSLFCSFLYVSPKVGCRGRVEFELLSEDGDSDTGISKDAFTIPVEKLTERYP